MIWRLCVSSVALAVPAGCSAYTPRFRRVEDAAVSFDGLDLLMTEAFDG
jgi:hypothetical protein